MDSVDAVRTAWQQLDMNNIQVISMTFFVFDWIITFSEEIEYIWKSKWSFPKVLYLWTRYSPILDTVLGLLSHFAFPIEPEGCKLNNVANSLALGVGVWTSEMVLLWRTCAIWHDSRAVKYGLGILWVASIPPDLYFLISYVTSTVYAPQPFAGQPGCNQVKGSALVAGDFIMLLIIESVIVILTVIKGVQHMRGVPSNPLMLTLYRDGVMFFVYLFMISLANVMAPLIGPRVDALLLPTLLRISHSLLCCRVILHIRNVAAETCNGGSTTKANNNDMQSTVIFASTHTSVVQSGAYAGTTETITQWARSSHPGNSVMTLC